MSEQQNNGNYSLFDDPIIFWSMIIGGIIVFIVYFEPGFLLTPWKFLVNINAHIINLLYFDPRAHSIANEIIEWTNNVHPKNISSAQFNYVQGVMSGYLAYFYLGSIFLFGLVTYFVTRNQKKHKQLQLEDLIAKESANWPPLKYYLKHNPLKHSSDEGAFSTRTKPWEWARDNKLFSKMKVTREDGTEVEEHYYNDAKSEQVLSEQLGDLCRTKKDIMSQNTAYKCVLLLALGRLGKKKKKGNDTLHKIAVLLGKIEGEEAILGYISEHYASSDKEMKSNEKTFNDTIDEFLDSILEDKKIRVMLLASHAYANTILVRSVEEARRFGIMPSSWFPFLHTEDKLLNYIVNDIGRKTPSIVCAGVFSHYRAERLAKKALTTPWVDGVKIKDKLIYNGLPIKNIDPV